jgi:hypothetical protein
VERRFGDFEALWKYLSVVAFRLPVQLPEMPVGGVKTFLSRNESSVVSARRVAFQRLLVLIADTPALQLLSPVVSFLLPTATALTGMRRASFTSGASLMATSSVMLGTSGIMAAPASSRMTPPSLVTPALSRRMLVPVRGPGTSGGAAAAAAMTTPALVAVAATPALAAMAATPAVAGMAGAGSRTVTPRSVVMGAGVVAPELTVAHESSGSGSTGSVDDEDEEPSSTRSSLSL